MEVQGETVAGRTVSDLGPIGRGDAGTVALEATFDKYRLGEIGSIGSGE